jgi:hypothetical protein
MIFMVLSEQLLPLGVNSAWACALQTDLPQLGLAANTYLSD